MRDRRDRWMTVRQFSFRAHDMMEGPIDSSHRIASHRTHSLEIGDLDGRVRVDLLVARRLALDVAVELLEEDLVAQELGAAHCTLYCTLCTVGRSVNQSISQSVSHALRTAAHSAHVQAVDVHMRTLRPCTLGGFFDELVDVPGRQQLRQCACNAGRDKSDKHTCRESSR